MGNKHKAVQVDLYACNDGTHYCECEGDKPEKERVLMRQLPGHLGKEVFAVCDNRDCRAYGHQLYVPYRKADRELARGRREAGELDYTRVCALWRGDEKVTAINFLARQAIEHYHQQRFEMFGLGSKDRRSGRRFIGDHAVRFWHVLGDLLWNLTIRERLDEGFEPEVLNPQDVYAGLLANGRNVARLRELGRRGRIRRAEHERRTGSRRGRFKRTRPPDPAVQAA